LGHKLSKGGCATDQALHLSYIPRWLHIQDGLDFIWVSFDVAATDHEAEELSQSNSKDALLWVELHVERSKSVKRLLQITTMIPLGLTFHNHVVDVYFHGLTNERLEQFVN